jgi:hypothetical protein
VLTLIQAVILLLEIPLLEIPLLFEIVLLLRLRNVMTTSRGWAKGKSIGCRSRGLVTYEASGGLEQVARL